MSKYVFSMDNKTLVKEIANFVAMGKARDALAKKLLAAVSEHVVFEQNGKLLMDMYAGFNKAEQITFKNVCSHLLPVTWRKDDDAFKWSLAKALEISKEFNLNLTAPEKGKTDFSDEDKAILARHLCNTLKVINWFDYKPEKETVKKEVTDESLAKEAERLAKKAQEAGLEVPVTLIGTVERAYDFGEYLPLFKALHAKCKVDDEMLLMLRELVDGEAADAIGGNAVLELQEQLEDAQARKEELKPLIINGKASAEQRQAYADLSAEITELEIAIAA